MRLHEQLRAALDRAQPAAVAYHVTTMTALRSIMRDGILPQQGPRSMFRGEKQPAAYLFVGRDEVENALQNWLGEAFEDLPPNSLAILEVAVRKEQVAAAKKACTFEIAEPSVIAAARIMRVFNEDFTPMRLCEYVTSPVLGRLPGP